MAIESPDDQDFLEYFLSVVCEHDSPKLIPTVTEDGESLSLFEVAWSAGLAEEAGNYPLLAAPASDLSYFIFHAKSTGFTGYISYKPINH